MTSEEKQISAAFAEEEKRIKKQKEIERLKAEERFIRKDEGIFRCNICDYQYEPKKGEAFANIKPETPFDELPESFRCPVCRATKSAFVPKDTVIAGFASNQSYGFGSNSLTPGQKNILIFGGLFLLFVLLLAGYGFN